ncbi:NAD(P)H-binding protein [Halorubrum sp. CBA1125]|uniref:complex I NDUFA9 subunit family protein n=1 Tax=Halorubrum sp. CBA1125 TaxID=2668072 RepID=UPI0012E8FDB7|nr:complex I NDUFA9 subunit family protein [Halorubrum sp. CBA1125]MUW15234.1 NAD(P)H-binding protein [Halorubrum sp. CBA1125]
MDVLVAGGTGFIGSYLCGALVDAGHEVTALSRSPGEGPDGVETATGEVTDADSIADAVDGRDAVVNLVALSPLFEPKGGNVMHDRVHRGGTANLVQAAEGSGVDRFVQLSALGADPDGETAYIRAKGAAEAIVRESGLDWTIFRPSVVFGDGGEFVSFTKRLKGMFAPGVPLYPLPGGGKTRFQPIHVEDLVPMLVAAVEDDEHVGETYEVGGPETLTLREVTDLVYEAEGRDVTIVPLPMPFAKVGLTVLGAVPGFPMGPDQYQSLKFDNTTADNDAVAFGVDPSEMTTLSAYLGVT